MSIDPQRAIELVRQAPRVAILSGAGMSAESGVPTFRDALTGLWSNFDPKDLATESAFRQNPRRVFSWYLHRLAHVRRVEPHAGYRALVALERQKGATPIVTQNVDGLHRQAGSRNVIELHGSLTSFCCVDRRHPFPLDDVLKLVGVNSEELAPPRCRKCGSWIRPGVVWFGETLPADAITRAWKAVEDADVLLVIGTSAVVYPAADLPLYAKSKGTTVIEINPEPTSFTPFADVFWKATAGAALPEIV